MQIEFFNFLRSVVKTEDGLVLYALALIVSMEIIDFLTGTIAAIANPDIEYKSKNGINGLLRKILGVLLLMILIPMSVLLPEKTGFAFLYSIYLGYIAFTFQSLIENYRKLKGNVTLFQPILKAFQRLFEKDEDKNYLFSIPQLIEKIKTEYQRQIGKRESNIEFRKFEEKEKYYYLVVIFPLDPYDVYQKPTTNLVIDGQTGQTLYQETIQYQRDGNDSKANPIEDFLRQQTK